MAQRGSSADTLNDRSTDGGSSVGADDDVGDGHAEPLPEPEPEHRIHDTFVRSLSNDLEMQELPGKRHAVDALTFSALSGGSPLAGGESSQPQDLDDKYDKNEPLKRWAEDVLVRVPESVLLRLRRSLSGPCTENDSQVLRVRVWTLIGSYHVALGGGYLAYCLGSQLHTDSTYTMVLTYSTIPVWGVVAVLLGEAGFSMGRALLDRDDSGASGLSSDKPLPTISENLLVGGAVSPHAGPRGHTNFNWMVELLQANVSVDVRSF